MFVIQPGGCRLVKLKKIKIKRKKDDELILHIAENFTTYSAFGHIVTLRYDDVIYWPPSLGSAPPHAHVSAACSLSALVTGPAGAGGTKRSFVRPICVSATRFAFSVHSVLRGVNRRQTALSHAPASRVIGSLFVWRCWNGAAHNTQTLRERFPVPNGKI